MMQHAHWPPFNFPDRRGNLPRLQPFGYRPEKLVSRSLLLPGESYLSGAQRKALSDLRRHMALWAKSKTFGSKENMRTWLRWLYDRFNVLFFLGNVKRNTMLNLPTGFQRKDKQWNGYYKSGSITIFLCRHGDKTFRPVLKLASTLLHEMVHAYLDLFSCRRQECCAANRLNGIGAEGHGIMFHFMIMLSMRRLMNWIPELQTEWKEMYEREASHFERELAGEQYAKSREQLEQEGLRPMQEKHRRMVEKGAGLDTSESWQKNQKKRMREDLAKAFSEADITRRRKVVHRAYPTLRGRFGQRELGRLFKDMSHLRDRVDAWVGTS
ncbi:hypothetical protein MKZ38_008421 [Zalerion maritima]|uniref:SprT-like domain-containing protein n=1 Tax=Zalerion maritima TaxID=339359 RepID=A0AAD5WNL2_9PEZI|nr:hypothetical protein MKZ38_008421 [Zalerion maritima]